MQLAAIGLRDAREANGWGVRGDALSSYSAARQVFSVRRDRLVQDGLFEINKLLQARAQITHSAANLGRSGRVGRCGYEGRRAHRRVSVSCAGARRRFTWPADLRPFRGRDRRRRGRPHDRLLRAHLGRPHLRHAADAHRLRQARRHAAHRVHDRHGGAPHGDARAL
eukprot:2760823-Prymnesium_polylepis.1